MAQVQTDAFGAIAISEDDQHHLSNVLRLRAGDNLVATDGRGSWCECAWVADGRVVQTNEVKFEERLRPDIEVAFSLLKGDRPDWIVQKLTEVGVDHIIPMIAERTVLRWDDEKSLRNAERFRRIAYEAAMQSRRVWLPEVAEVTQSRVVIESGFTVAQPGGAKVSLDQSSVAVGPEGGWTPAEIGASKSQVDLGPSILRAETAAATIGGLLMALRADLLDLPHSVLNRR